MPRRPAAGDDHAENDMGKRSSFERVPRDFYPTPLAAVPPLIPHLGGVRRLAEPCCGDGALVRHLEAHGLRCVHASDIATGQDALISTAMATLTRSSPTRPTPASNRQAAYLPAGLRSCVRC